MGDASKVAQGFRLKHPEAALSPSSSAFPILAGGSLFLLASYLGISE